MYSVQSRTLRLTVFLAGCLLTPAFVAAAAPALSLYPTSGLRGTLFCFSGVGFTPNGGIREEIVKPNGSFYPTNDPNLNHTAFSDGTFRKEYSSVTATKFGGYVITWVDAATGARSNPVYETIFDAPYPVSPQLCNNTLTSLLAPQNDPISQRPPEPQIGPLLSNGPAPGTQEPVPAPYASYQADPPPPPPTSVQNIGPLPMTSPDISVQSAPTVPLPAPQPAPTAPQQSQSFSYQPPTFIETITVPTLRLSSAPVIRGISRYSGAPGVVIKIWGENFKLGKVIGGGIKVSFTVGSSRLNTQFTLVNENEIDAVIPIGMGTAEITVSTTGGTSNAVSFTYEFPKVHIVSPSSGEPGAPAIITGSNFGVLGDWESVRFGETVFTSIRSWSDKRIEVTAPLDYGRGTIEQVIKGTVGCVALDKVRAVTTALGRLTRELVVQAAQALAGTDCIDIARGIYERYKLRIQPDFTERTVSVAVRTFVGESNSDHTFIYRVPTEEFTQDLFVGNQVSPPVAPIAESALGNSALLNLTPISTDVFTYDLAEGMVDNRVRALQKFLQEQGFFPQSVQPTGYFGSITKEAVQKFQEFYGIPTVGRVGPLTRAKLNQLLK